MRTAVNGLKKLLWSRGIDGGAATFALSASGAIYWMLLKDTKSRGAAAALFELVDFKVKTVAESKGVPASCGLGTVQEGRRMALFIQ